MVAAAAAAVYLVADPQSADLAAQRFRTDLFEREGFTLFSTAWYGGHHTPGYSVLFPPLAALLGPQLVGALAAVLATALVAALAGERGRLAGLAFVPGIVASLVSGRLAFTVGAAFAIAAVLAAARGRTALAAFGGLLTALASPVAALFAALAGAALATADLSPPHSRGLTPTRRGGSRGLTPTRRGGSRGQTPTRRTPTRRGGSRGLTPGVGLAVAAVLPVVFLVVAFPEGGTFPFVLSAFLPSFLAGVAVALAAPPQWRAVRIGAALYALLALAAFAIPTPLGGNAARLGTLFAAPVALLLLWPRRRVALALLAVPIAYWVLQPAVRDYLRAHDDPSTEAAFHAPVAGFLAARQPARVAIPFTQNHGEAFHLARRFAISRGWERQVDIERNELFYEGELTRAEYLAWLEEDGIGYVAVPLGLPMDASGEDEKRIALTLREVFRTRDWRVMAGPGRLGVAELRPEGFVLNASQPGANTIRVRFTPYWALLEGKGCVEPAPGGWTRVRVHEAGRVEVGTRFALGRIRATSSRCTD